MPVVGLCFATKYKASIRSYWGYLKPFQHHTVPIIHQNITDRFCQFQQQQQYILQTFLRRKLEEILSVVSSTTLFYEPTRPYINNEAAFILSSRVFPLLAAITRPTRPSS
jgi:hypothetical protein